MEMWIFYFMCITVDIAGSSEIGFTLSSGLRNHRIESNRIRPLGRDSPLWYYYF